MRADTLTESIGKQPGRNADWRRLRGALWLAYAIYLSGLDAAEFAARFVHRGRSRSNLLAKWQAGLAIPSRLSAQQLEKVLPGTLALFDHPLFPLLAARSVSKRQIDDLLRKFRKKDSNGWVWDFPNYHSRWSFFEDDSGLLRRLGGLWGLFAIVLLIRDAESTHDPAMHVTRCEEMYRCVPSLLIEPWIRPFDQLLKRCLDTLKSRVPLSRIKFDVDWSVLVAISGSDNPLAYPDPILETEIVSRKDLSVLTKFFEAHHQSDQKSNGG